MFHEPGSSIVSRTGQEAVPAIALQVDGSGNRTIIEFPGAPVGL